MTFFNILDSNIPPFQSDIKEDFHSKRNNDKGKELKLTQSQNGNSKTGSNF